MITDYKTQALMSLRPGAQWSLSHADDKLTWLDTEQIKPTNDEIDAEIIKLKTNYDAKEYQRKRVLEYPVIGDQLDMLWHAIDDGTLDKTSTFYTSLKVTKDKYSKT